MTKSKDLRLRLDKAVKDSGLDSREFAIKAGIAADTLAKAVERGSLSAKIVKKFYDTYGIPGEYWENGGDLNIKKESSTGDLQVLQMRLLATMDQLASICKTDNDQLWKQNDFLLRLVEKLSLPTSGANQN